jgi:Protein of unknwon function (DUF3310)
MERRLDLYTSDSSTENPIEDKRLHPDHYSWFLEKFGVNLMDIVAELNFNRGNAIKYIIRAGHKKEEGIKALDKEIEDLNKAIIYLIHEVKRLEISKLKIKDASV